MLPRLPSSLAAALLLALAQPAAAVEIRVATLNVELGVGQPGTLEFNAVSQVLKRLDADVVALQEVRRADTDGSPSSLDALASGAGYAHRFAPGFLPLDSNTRTILLSKFPLAETAAVGPPPGANDMARAHAAARVDVPGTASDPLVIGVHLKCCADPDDPFRRAVEIAHLRGFLAAQAGAGDRVIALGDFNLLGEAETFDALPPGLPQSYDLASSIAFPVAYSPNPQNFFAADALPLIRLPNRALDGSTDTHALGATLDHILASTALIDRAHAGEIYDSQLDANPAPGLPLAGIAPPRGASVTASDHRAVFADFELDGPAQDTDGDGIANDLDPDDDNDGIGDAGELAFGTSPVHADSDQNGIGDGAEDGDGDGSPDAAEVLVFLTDPADPLSRFALTIGQTGPDAAALRFPTKAGRTYRVEARQPDGAWATLATHAGTGAEIAEPISLGGGRRQLWRVAVTAP